MDITLGQGNHHELVQMGVETIIEEERSVGGQLGRPSGARFRTYARLKNYAQSLEGTLFSLASYSGQSKTSTDIRCVSLP